MRDRFHITARRIAKMIYADAAPVSNNFDDRGDITSATFTAGSLGQRRIIIITAPEQLGGDATAKIFAANPDDDLMVLLREEIWPSL